MMRIVFCGTPSFAVPTLKHLLAQTEFEITGVITQPDRPPTRRLEAGMDTGDILLQKPINISPDDPTASLATRLAEAGAPLMADTLRGAGAGTVSARPQDHTQATSAPLLKKDDGKIDWARSPHEIYHRIHAFTPWPAAFTTFRGHTYHLVAE